MDDGLIESHLGLVRSIAVSVQRRLPIAIPLDDLISAGTLALVLAAARYRPDEHGGCPFGAYIRQRVRGAMLELVRRRPLREAICARLDEVAEPVAELHMESRLDAARLMERIRAAIAGLPEKQRAVIEAFYDSELTITEIARDLSLSVSYVASIRAEGIRELQAKLAGDADLAA